MIHSEKEYKMLEEQLRKLKNDNKLKDKENKLLRVQNKQKDEIIKDLDRYDYRGQCQTLKLENEELKKKLKIYEEKFELLRISQRKDSSNSCKPSSTNGLKKVIQNNRVKSERNPGREKGHKKSAPTVSLNPDNIVQVPKVATCTCGHKTKEKETVSRDLISLEVIVHTTQYTGTKTICPCCNKEYLPKFPDNVKEMNKTSLQVGVLFFSLTRC